MTTQKPKEGVTWRKSIKGRRAIGYIFTFALLLPAGNRLCVALHRNGFDRAETAESSLRFSAALDTGNGAMGELRRWLVWLRLRQLHDLHLEFSQNHDQ